MDSNPARVAGSRAGLGERGVSSTWRERTDLLPLEAKVCGDERARGAAAQTARRRECTIEASGRRASPRQHDAERPGKKMDVTVAQRRTAVTELQAQYAVSERRACRVVALDRGTRRYQTRRVTPMGLIERLCALAALRPRWGYRRLHILLRREGFAVNVKRVQRLYRQLGLAVTRRRGRKRVAMPRQPMVPPSRPNERWSIDFVSDAVAHGRRFRCLTIVDDFTRECPAIEVETSLPG